MTSTEGLVETYLESKDMKRESGKSLVPLLPLIMMDAQYQLYRKYIHPLQCKHKLKQVKRDWVRSYTEFNRDVFKVMDGDQTDRLVDLMDNFEEHIQHHIDIAMYAFMECAMECDLETRKVISACLLCNAIAQSAQIVWGDVYKGIKNHAHQVANLLFVSSNYEDKENKNIERVRYKAYEFARLFYQGTENIQCNQSKRVSDAMSVLCKQMVGWLVKLESKG